MKLLVDMNLSPDWIDWLERHGWEAVHWSMVGHATADDRTIMNWASANQRVVFTHDLDFGAMLALTHATGPSVLQLRGPRVLPSQVGATLLTVPTTYASELESGALIVIDDQRLRLRVLPL